MKLIPDYRFAVTPHIFVKGAAKAIEFCEQAFGATKRFSYGVIG